MGVSGGPDISSNGLLLYLDALNPSSYVSGSTTWYDISGNRNHCTLNNGPAYSTNGGVSLSFDGTDDYEYVIFSRNLRKNGIPQYLENSYVSGYLTLTENLEAIEKAMEGLNGASKH